MTKLVLEIAALRRWLTSLVVRRTGILPSKVCSPKLIPLLVILSSIFYSGLVSSQSTIENLRIWRAPDNTRLVFDLSGPAEHTLFSLEDPLRLVIDIEQTAMAADASSLKIDDTPISGFRFGDRENNGLRVVLDMKQEVKPRSFTLQPNENYGHRLVVDLYDELESAETSIEDMTSENRDIVIAIGAGHGGEDPGAIGPGGLREKDVVLSIAQKLHDRINQEEGYSAMLIRTGDYYIALRDRSLQARESRADLFLSIHADAFTHPSARGASVFALSERGATSETARMIANTENRSDLIGGVGDLSLDDKDDALASVLLDLSMSATMETSLEAGAEILREIGELTTLHKKTVEQAGFVVLKSPDIPSLLIETGFISNPTEAKNLSSPTFQTQMAESIFRGVKNYYATSAPPGTLISTMAAEGNRDYVIRSGDTLSLIAQRYNVSLDSLKELNNIQGSLIRVGQTIRIPAS